MKENLSRQLYNIFVTRLASLSTERLPTWWRVLCEEAKAQFLQQGFPTQKSEAYRYTPLASRIFAPFAQDLTSLPSPNAPIQLIAKQLPGYHIVLDNGHLQPVEKMPPGVVIKPFSKVSTEESQLLAQHFGKHTQAVQDPFIALNAAFCQEGLLITIAAEHQVDLPIYLHDYTTATRPATSHERLLLHMKKGSTAHVVRIPYALGGSPTFITRVQEIILAEEAHLHYYDLAITSMPLARLLSYMAVDQQRSSAFQAYSLTLGGDLIRHQITAQLTGEKASAQLYGSYLGKGESHIEKNLLLVHKAPNTASRTCYKGVVTDCSTGTFHGILNVSREAQKTDASQYHHGWLLQDKAHIYARPSLVIQADDVICQHGTTIAQPRDDELLYLRTRGIPAPQAKQMLLEAFLRETIAQIKLPELVEYLEEIVSKACVQLIC